MIRTDHPIALALVLVLLAGSVVGLEFGVIAGTGTDTQSADPLPGPDRNVSSNLTDDEGRIIAERLYEEVPARFERKRANYSRAVEIQEPTGFINAERVNISEHIGEKVILVEFWTFGCYNCQNTHPHIKEFHREYGDEGLVVIGVHKPEFSYERKPANVREFVRETNTTYPVVLDNRDATWNAYDQRYWPTRYLIGVDGFIRYKHVGEGAYDFTERKIEELLAERDRVVNGTR